jgi:UDP-N-acetylmuramate dehydrogenase
MNTLGVECEADELVLALSVDDIERTVRRSLDQQLPLTVLGCGSNVILRRRIKGVVLRLGNGGWRVETQSAEHAHIWVGAGMNWHALTQQTLTEGLSGLENLSLIPGTAGAAPIQNIGAYGVEVGERVERVDAIDLTSGERVSFSHSDCEFGYRHSRFKLDNRYLIIGLVVRLDRFEHTVTTYPDVARALAEQGIREPRSQQIANVVITIRRSKLPAPEMIGNAGSFFKNPIVTIQSASELAVRISDLRRFPVPTKDSTHVKLAAAQLIDLAGWKGKEQGGVGVWATQPLVLVNRGTTHGSAFLAMANAIQTDVEHRFGVALELEPVVLGYD